VSKPDPRPDLIGWLLVAGGVIALLAHGWQLAR
jgi:hypothetical protein